MCIHVISAREREDKTHIHAHTHTYTHTYIYIYIYIHTKRDRYSFFACTHNDKYRERDLMCIHMISAR